jgi:hypothetical protein
VFSFGKAATVKKEDTTAVVQIASVGRISRMLSQFQQGEI